MVIFYLFSIKLSIFFNKYKFILYINLITLHYYYLLSYYHPYLRNATRVY